MVLQSPSYLVESKLLQNHNFLKRLWFATSTFVGRLTSFLLKLILCSHPVDTDSLSLHGAPVWPLFKYALVISAQVRTMQRPVALTKDFRAEGFPCRGRWNLIYVYKETWPNEVTHTEGLLMSNLCQFPIITSDKLCAIQSVPRARWNECTFLVCAPLRGCSWVHVWWRSEVNVRYSSGCCDDWTWLLSWVLGDWTRVLLLVRQPFLLAELALHAHECTLLTMNPD